MADKSFGVRQLNLIGPSGTPTITSPNNLNVNAVTVAISTDVSIGGQVTSNVIVGSGKSVGIGSTLPSANLDVSGTIRTQQLSISGVSTFIGIVTSTSTLFANQLNVSGVSTFSATTFLNQLNVTGFSTVGILSATEIRGTHVSNLYIKSPNVYISTVDPVSPLIAATFSNGTATLYKDSSVILQTNSSGITVTGVVTATSFSGSGAMQSRTVVSGLTTSIANNGIGNTNITGFKSYALLRVGLSTAAWLRLYTDSTSRANDASRSIGIDPTPGSGVIAEVVTTGISTTQIITPFTIGGNLDTPVSSTIYAAITNLSGSTQAINAQLTILQLEV